MPTEATGEGGQMTNTEMLIQDLRHTLAVTTEEANATIAELRAELAARDQQMAEQAKMLHDLTPGGSEYVDNPTRCYDWVQDRMSDLLRDAVRLAKERNGLRRERDALLAHFNACSDCHDCAVESGTLIVTVVETEETVNVRTP